jgi:hypothetical protein
VSNNPYRKETQVFFNGVLDTNKSKTIYNDDALKNDFYIKLKGLKKDQFIGTIGKREIETYCWSVRDDQLGMSEDFIPLKSACNKLGFAVADSNGNLFPSQTITLRDGYQNPIADFRYFGDSAGIAISRSKYVYRFQNNWFNKFKEIETQNCPKTQNGFMRTVKKSDLETVFGTSPSRMTEAQYFLMARGIAVTEGEKIIYLEVKFDR